MQNHEGLVQVLRARESRGHERSEGDPGGQTSRRAASRLVDQEQGLRLVSRVLAGRSPARRLPNCETVNADSASTTLGGRHRE